MKRKKEKKRKKKKKNKLSGKIDVFGGKQNKKNKSVQNR